MKKFIVLVVTMVLVVTTVLPETYRVGAADAQATESKPVSRILTMSDYQKWNSDYTADNWDFLKPQLQGIVDGAASAGVDPDYFLFGGDYSCLNNTATSENGMGQVLDIVRGKWQKLVDDRCVMIQGNHDPAGTKGMRATGAYEFDDFIIYVLNEDDFPTKQGDASVLPGIQKTSSDLKKWLEKKISEKETRPIFIASHAGLHYDIDRTDGNNQYAYVMFDAINDAAKQLDVVFFFGHNHTNGDEQVGGSLTFYDKGKKLNVCDEKSIGSKRGTPSTLNFTYMNYGYVGYVGDIKNNSSEFTPTDVLTLSELSVYKDRIEIKRYSKDGLYEAGNRTIMRNHAEKPEKTAERISVSYDAAGGTVPVDQEYIYPGNYRINREVPVREGFLFAGYRGNDEKIYSPGQEIPVSETMTLTAVWTKLPAGEKYILTDTITPGKQYVLVYNKDISGNEGEKYAVSVKNGKVDVDRIDPEHVIGDGAVLWFENGKIANHDLWDILYNTGQLSATGYQLQNLDTKQFLMNENGQIGIGADPIGTEANSSGDGSVQFKSYTWKYANRQLVMYNDNTQFIRYSVTGKNVKLGSTSVSTDGNNSNVFFYCKVTDDEYVWEQADELESNQEYLIVNRSESGTAKAMATNDRTISTKDVSIKTGDDGKLYIEGEYEYNDPLVYHTYGLSDGTFWLDTWNNAAQGEVIRMDSGAVKVTSNHADPRYYFRFKYDSDGLQAFGGFDGSAARKLVFSGTFTEGDGNPVAIYKRVYKGKDGKPEAQPQLNPQPDPEPNPQPQPDPQPQPQPQPDPQSQTQPDPQPQPQPQPRPQTQTKAETKSQSQKASDLYKIGDKFSAGGVDYVITGGKNDSGVTVVSGNKKAKTVKIPAAVTYNNIAFKVTVIGKNAFKKCKSVKKAVIGANVKRIENNAFSGCRNLKTVQIQSKVLTKIGKNAFHKIRKNAIFKINKKNYKKIMKMIRKSRVQKVKFKKQK